MDKEKNQVQTPVAAHNRFLSKEEEYVHKQIEQQERETEELRKRLRLEEAITDLKHKIDDLRWL